MHCTHAHTVTFGSSSSLVCVRVISIHGHRHAHLFLSVVFFLVSLYLVLKSFFHLFLNPAMVPDENSMEDPLCNSSFGSMVSLDYVTPDTISMPNFEVLDARIASALNKIIHNSKLKRRISLEEQKAQKEDRFLRGRQIAYLIYDQFRVTGTHDSVENYTDLFTIVLRNDDIQEFDSKWDGILLSMTKIPHDDILEGLYKLRIRESENL